MSNPTSNFNWQMPTSTDLVTDLPADFEVFGQAVDTTMATMLPKTVVDAKGDLIAGTAADTVARLAVGTNGQVLKADSTAATGLAWGDSGTNTGMTLISAVTTTGTSTIQVTGLGSYDKIVVLAQWTPSSAAFGRVRLNNDSGSVYRMKQSRMFRDSTDNFTQNYMENLTQNDAIIGFSTAASSTTGGSGGSNTTSNYRIEVTGLKSTTGFKSFTATQQLYNGSLDLFYQNTGIYESTTAVTTIDFVLSAGTFGSTNIRVYGA
jgi:hypothetical protein